jgi:hypothetical protein
MPQVLTIAIPDELVDELRDLAHGEYRNPRKQATVLLIEAIRRAVSERAGDVSRQAADASPLAEPSVPMG